MASWDKIDRELDLVLVRLVSVPDAHLHRGWTEPELLKQWFTPARTRYRAATKTRYAEAHSPSRCAIPKAMSFRARAVHGTREQRYQHADMGFESGWGAATRPTRGALRQKRLSDPAVHVKTTQD